MLALLLIGFRLDFCNGSRAQKARMMPLPECQKSVTTCPFALTQYRLTVWRTDGETDTIGKTMSRSACICMLKLYKKRVFCDKCCEFPYFSAFVAFNWLSRFSRSHLIPTHSKHCSHYSCSWTPNCLHPAVAKRPLKIQWSESWSRSPPKCNIRC